MGPLSAGDLPGVRGEGAAGEAALQRHSRQVVDVDPHDHDVLTVSHRQNRSGKNILKNYVIKLN